MVAYGKCITCMADKRTRTRRTRANIPPASDLARGDVSQCITIYYVITYA